MNKKLFVMASVASIITPAFVLDYQVEADTQIDGFSDVPTTHSYYSVIMEMKKQGLINGYNDGTFRPTESIKRSHVAALLTRSVELKPIREAVEFSDVPTSHPYHDEIQQLYRAGIVDGVNGQFNPNGNLTRIQMAKMLTLAFDLKVKSDISFPDVPESHWGSEYVKALYSNGVTTGNGGLFNPSEIVSRQHYALFLLRALNANSYEPPSASPKPDVETPPIEEVPVVVDVPINLEPTPESEWRSAPTTESTLIYNYPNIPTVPKYFGRTGQEHFEKQLEELEAYAFQFNQTGYSASVVDRVLANIDTTASTTGYTKSELLQIYNYVITTGKVFKSERLVAFYTFNGAKTQNMLYRKML